MTKMKRAVSILLCAVLMLTAAPLGGLAGLEWPDFSALFATKAQAADPTSGTCGKNLTWNYNETTKTLTISGTGMMSNYSCTVETGGVTTAPWGPYYNTVKTVVIQNGVTNIGDYAFVGCTELTRATIPDSVTSIGVSAFADCIGLTSIAIPNSVTSIGNGAFEYCSGLTSISIGIGVTRNVLSAFRYCTGLSSITVASGNPVYHSAGNCLIKTANKELVMGCKTSIIPSDGSVISIGSDAFWGCTGLTNITIPNSITSIGQSVFSNCVGLTSVTIPNSVISIGYEAYSGCTGLTSITVASGNPVYHSTGNCIIKTATKELILGCRNSIIPSDGSVAGIGEFAFSRCTGLTSIAIPGSVTSIGNYAFYLCTGLTSVTIPDNVTSIGWAAFSFCTGLKDVYYGGSEKDRQHITISEENDYLLNAVWHYSSDTPEEPIDPSKPPTAIRGYVPTMNVDYKASVTFKADLSNAPAGAQAHWIINGKDVHTGETYTVPAATADYTVQIKLIGADGTELYASEVETVKVKTDFFSRLIAFFRSLFGALPKITQAIKETL